jgi:hypothetical protein
VCIYRPPFGLVHLRCAFTLAHRARCAAAIFLRAGADVVCLDFSLPARPIPKLLQASQGSDGMIACLSEKTRKP